AEEDLGPPLAEATLHVITRYGPPLSVVLQHLASAPGEAEDALAPEAAQVLAQEILRGRVLREHHHLFVAGCFEFLQNLAQHAGLCVLWQGAGLVQQPLDFRSLLDGRRLALGSSDEACIHDVVARLVVGLVFADRELTWCMAPHGREPLLQRAPQGGEAACDAATVDRHDEPDGAPLLLGCPVIRRRDVRLHGPVDGPFFGRHFDEAILDRALRDRRVDLPRLIVGTEQLARVTRDEARDRRRLPEQPQRGPALASLQLTPRDVGRISQCVQDPLGAQPAGRSRRDCGLHWGLAVRALRRAEHARQLVELLVGRAGLLQDLEEAQERRLTPFRRHTQEVEQIPNLDRVHLHRRCGEQQQPLRAMAELTHEAQEHVRPALGGRAGALPARVVGLIQDDEVPRFGLLAQLALSVVAAHEVAGRDDRRFAAPFVPRRLPGVAAAHARRRQPGELAAVVHGPVEVELLPQLDLPLPHDGGGRQDQNAAGAARQPHLPDQHPGLDRLAEPDLIRDEQAWRFHAVEAHERPDLVRPRLLRTRRLAYSFATLREPGRVPDEGPDAATEVDRRGTWWLRLWRLLVRGRLEPGRAVVRGE